MAIRMMTSLDRLFEPNIEVEPFTCWFSIDEIQHDLDCPNRNKAEGRKSKLAGCSNACCQKSPLVMETSYKGCVLETRERNGHDDSDFYAYVWDELTQTVKSVEYASTRGWSYPNGASVDATNEVKEKAKEFYIRQTTKTILRETNEISAKLVIQGKTCRVIKGRKIAKGTIVKVLGSPQKSIYGYNTEVFNVLVALPNGSGLKTNVENLEVIQPEQYHISEAQAETIAREQINGAGNYVSMSLASVPSRIREMVGNRL